MLPKFRDHLNINHMNFINGYLALLKKKISVLSKEHRKNCTLSESGNRSSLCSCLFKLPQSINVKPHYIASDNLLMRILARDNAHIFTLKEKEIFDINNFLFKLKKNK
ncbi:hypothetical protein BpHYR1_016298 [Brachionus plicatilis]|uniref:Uncharacterized protein n=1 Tax=Brachionus plicatilis TaxID=10195 RepID=A0A3M7QMQ7_BRAPC|nr:hypothetical protein BpHYR1_016298 [Brachionus plicatilis]